MRGFFNCGLCGEVISPTQKAQHMKEKHKGEEEHPYKNNILDTAIMPKKRGRNIIVAKTKTKMHEQIKNALKMGILKINATELLSRKDAIITFEQGFLVVKVPVLK